MPLGSGVGTLLVSITMRPASSGPTSWTSEAKAVPGTASTTTSASSIAARLDGAADAPVAAAAASACSTCVALMRTEWPARTAAPASAWPTLPAPMMASFMMVLLIWVLLWSDLYC